MLTGTPDSPGATNGGNIAARFRRASASLSAIAPLLSPTLGLRAPPSRSPAAMAPSTQHEPSYRMLTMVIMCFAVVGVITIMCVKLAAPSRLRANLEYLGVAVNKAAFSFLRQLEPSTSPNSGSNPAAGHEFREGNREEDLPHLWLTSSSYPSNPAQQWCEVRTRTHTSCSSFRRGLASHPPHSTPSAPPATSPARRSVGLSRERDGRLSCCGLPSLQSNMLCSRALWERFCGKRNKMR